MNAAMNAGTPIDGLDVAIIFAVLALAFLAQYAYRRHAADRDELEAVEAFDPGEWPWPYVAPEWAVARRVDESFGRVHAERGAGVIRVEGLTG